MGFTRSSKTFQRLMRSGSFWEHQRSSRICTIESYKLRLMSAILHSNGKKKYYNRIFANAIKAPRKLIKCRGCHFIFVNRTLKRESVINFYIKGDENRSFLPPAASMISQMTVLWLKMIKNS